jgi:hypothetical protein
MNQDAKQGYASHQFPTMTVPGSSPGYVIQADPMKQPAQQVYPGQQPPAMTIQSGYPYGQPGFSQPPGYGQTTVVITGGMDKSQCLYELDKRYRCCCGGCCNIKVCVFVIAILEAISLIVALAMGIVDNGLSIYFHDAMITSTVSFVFGAIAVLCLLIGLCMESPCLLVPEMIFQILGIVGCISGFGVLVDTVAGATTVTGEVRDMGLSIQISFMCVFLIVLGIQIGFLVQVIRCFNYLRAKARLD